MTTKTKNEAKHKDQNKDDYHVKVNGKTIHLTHLTKMYWPEEEITKGDVINYYNAIHEFILPHLKDRPESMRRTPNGVSDKGFFQKDAGDDTPSWVKTKSIRAESANKDVDYIICNNLATLLYLNNLGCIELNPWNSRINHPDNPDYFVIDIDPPDSASFDQVIDVTLVIKEIIDKLDAVSFCKTSGATGMHIYMPLDGKHPYEVVRPLAQAIATVANKKLPKITTVERSLNKRKNRIYIDYLQNSKGQTLASVYSVRPVAGATVSTPLKWSEVKHGLSPHDFTMETVQQRLKKYGDLFEGVLTEKNDFEACLDKIKTLGKN